MAMNNSRVRRIVVANAKGGSGKTTVATNLASAYAAAGKCAALFDFDPQGSSTHWLKLRPSDLPEIHAIPAYQYGQCQVTRSFAQRVPAVVERVVVDTPAGLKGMDLRDQIKGADVILIPVAPSPIDMLATADFVSELLRAQRGSCFDARIALVANRVKKNTRMREALRHFMADLDIPVLGQVRDAQSYVIGAETGMGVAEFEPNRARADRGIWRQLLAWIEAAPEIERSVGVGKVASVGEAPLSMVAGSAY
ncbi:MAG TPA: ParA family protein [Candidatus Tenderia sp.]|nr:ParA family protein [Candidatus Tenderia sp.]